MIVDTLEVAVLTNDVEIEIRLSAMSASVQTDVHCWSSVGQATDAAEIARVLADRGFPAVCIGPDVPVDLALEVSRHLDRNHPEIGVVLLERADCRALAGCSAIGHSRHRRAG